MKNYEPPDGQDSEFEPGSGGKVLRNLLGITEAKLIQSVESQHLVASQLKFFDEFDLEHQFNFRDLCAMHMNWLGRIYPFAGKVRTVDIGKGGFQFASVRFLESNLRAFELEFLQDLTPCRGAQIETVSAAIAKVHGEFIMLHPFREGNGRLGRWIADAMAVQAGLPFPRYGFTERDESGYRARYLGAVKKAMMTDYKELSQFFAMALERALEEASGDPHR